MCWALKLIKRIALGPKKEKRGFSFIELLVAVSIISFLGIVIYATFSNGIKIWKRASGEKPEINIELMLEKVEMDLHNSFNASIGSFIGDKNKFSFFSVGKLFQGKGQSSITALPYQIEYKFDFTNGSFRKLEKDYRTALLASGDEWDNEKEKISLKDCRFQYYYYNVSEKSGVWVSVWKGNCLPAAIKIDMDYISRYGTKTISKMINIPTNVCQTKG